MRTDLMTPDDAVDGFWREGYMAVEGFLPESMATLAARYALMEYLVNRRPELSHGDRPAQVEGAHSVYGDSLCESILDLATPDVSALVGRRLIPTYAFYRVYRPGDSLRPHTDRIACEISASLCLGYQMDESASPWPLGFRTCDTDPVNLELEQRPGDLVVYQGCRCVHWRRPLRGGPDVWHAQVFLHWVDADGPYGELCALDCRPQLGMPESARDPGRVRAMDSENERRNTTKEPELRPAYDALSEFLCDDFTFAPDDDR